MASLLFLVWCCVLHPLRAVCIWVLHPSFVWCCFCLLLLFGGAALPPPVWWLCFPLLALGGSCCFLLSVWVVMLSPLPSLAWSCIPSSSSFWAVLLGLILLVGAAFSSSLWLVLPSLPSLVWCGRRGAAFHSLLFEWCCFPSFFRVVFPSTFFWRGGGCLDHLVSCPVPHGALEGGEEGRGGRGGIRAGVGDGLLFDEKCSPVSKNVIAQQVFPRCTSTHNTDSRDMQCNTATFD